jgi:hypothetical protein
MEALGICIRVCQRKEIHRIATAIAMNVDMDIIMQGMREEEIGINRDIIRNFFMCL